MRKTLIASLLFALFACGTEAKQKPWQYVIPIDKMTGKNIMIGEKVGSYVDIESAPWWAGLILFCSGDMTFYVNENYYSSSKKIKPVELDTVVNSELGVVVAELRFKFDNNEPLFTPWVIIKDRPGHANLPANLRSYEDFPKEQFPIADKMDKIRKEIIKGMTKHRSMWIEFRFNNTPHIAKFDLTGFSRELAKCSKIPVTN